MTLILRTKDFHDNLYCLGNGKFFRKVAYLSRVGKTNTMLMMMIMIVIMTPLLFLHTLFLLWYKSNVIISFASRRSYNCTVYLS